MASENKNENVMLTGQTAYFKKNGSMTNYGKITIDNQEQTHIYGPGFIDENSTLQPAALELSTDYTNTIESMEVHLADDFIEETEDYVVKANADNISTRLEERAPKLQRYVDSMNRYYDVTFLKTDSINSKLDLLIPVHLQSNFVLQIRSTFCVCNDIEYNIIDSDVFKLKQGTDNKFYINDAEIPNLEHAFGLMEFIQHDGRFFIKLNDKIIFENTSYFNVGTEITINTQFTNHINLIRVYGDNGITHKVVSKRDAINEKYGMYDMMTSAWYPTDVHIRLYYEYEYANIWNGAIDLNYCPGPKTGIEVTYKQYSSISGDYFRNIVGCYASYSMGSYLTFGLLVGSGSHLYCTRNNTTNNWLSSGIVSSTTKSTVTMNKYCDGRFKSTGGMTFNKAIPGTATYTNRGNATLWLAGGNDMGRYMKLDHIHNTSQVPLRSDIYIYNIKIYEGTQLVRDFVVARDLNNKQGLWEKIQGKLYPATKCSFSIRGNVIN